MKSRCPPRPPAAPGRRASSTSPSSRLRCTMQCRQSREDTSRTLRKSRMPAAGDQRPWRPRHTAYSRESIQRRLAALETIYVEYLAARGLTGDPGIAVGEQVAAAILPLRRVDPNPLPPPFTGGTAPGDLAADRVLPRQSTRSAVIRAHGGALDGVVRSIYADQPAAVPCPAAAGTDQRTLHARLQRSEGHGLVEQHRAQRRANRHRVFLQR